MGRSNDKFKRYITSRMNKMYDDILYSVELGVRSDHQYKILRSRILRSGNNALRDIVDEVDHYKLEEGGPRPRNMDDMDVD